MNDRPRRQQTRKRNDAYVYDTERSLDVSDKSAPAAKRSRRAARTAAAAAAAEQHAAAHDSDFDSVHSDSDADTCSSEEGDDDDADEVHEENSCSDDEACVELDAPLSKTALVKVSKMGMESLGEKTQEDYGVVIAALKRWAAAGGFREGGKPASLELGSMHRSQVANLLYRFFKWWIAGKAGDTVQGGKRDGEFGRSGAVKVHSALQKHLDGCCCQAGADSYHLRELNPYKGLYGKYCSKRRDIKLVAAAAASDKGMVRASQLHMAFGRESYLMGCRLLLESADHNDAMLLSMFTGQVSMVARGDDLRGRRLPELSSRLVACVGPSMAQSISVLQPPGTGKTLQTRPNFKGMLRAKLPELCAVGALARWLVCSSVAGKEMSRNNHAKMMRKLFGQLGVETAKITHELRIFATQLMYEMGVSLEVIQRIGAWLLDPFGTAYIVPGFTAEALLALAFWAGAAQKDFTGYWAERFMVAVPEELIQLLMPGMAALEAAVAAAIAAGKPDAVAANLAKLLRMLAVVAVQDALELAAGYPGNPVHKMLLQHERFKLLLEKYRFTKAWGGFEAQRPLGVKEAVKKMLAEQTEAIKQHVSQAVAGAGIAANSAAELNWQGYEQLQQAAQEDQRAEQQHSLTVGQVMSTLQKVAEGKLKPSAKLVQRIRQQEVVQADPQLAAEDSAPISEDGAASSEDGASSSDADADEGPGKTPQQLEAAGADDGYQWRGGQQHRPQRWAEYVQLLKAIEAARDRLTDKACTASQTPHRVARVEPVAAARELDAPRTLLRLSVCEYREFLNHTGKGYRKGRAAAAALPVEQWGQLPPELQAELQEAQQEAAD
ncbi:hypothetical protein OEZ85_014210 [Tetradesmus obliquus]|uniref:Ndc10 domain-containing protein n=1 Tax=Tetradesmus obliquus TaxID=3088 RepID=A0ABY8U7C2_TETOB|nr:hypothetical protein OEZ85_014210 [Tetradesmus obliquus]